MQTAEKLLKNEYETSQTKMGTPRIKIVNYFADKPRDDLENSISQQNPWIMDKDTLNITYVRKKSNN